MMLRGIRYDHSPNFRPRGKFRVTGTVLHYTAGGSFLSTVKWLTSEKSRASAHFVIGRKGEIAQLVDLQNAAWHAGQAEMQYEDKLNPNVNAFTIGIELCNWGLLRKVNDRFCIFGTDTPYEGPTPVEGSVFLLSGQPPIPGYWEPYADTQIQALVRLLALLRAEGFEDAVANIVGHEHVAIPKGRKLDPGPAFPWDDVKKAVQS